MERFVILRNFIITLPSIIYHGTLSLYQKILHNKKDNIIFNKVDTNNLILMVHGYHGHPCNFIPLVKNITDYDNTIKELWNMVAINLNQFDNYDDNTVLNESQLLMNFILEEEKYDNIILIGLSKGGLVCTTVYSNNNPKIKKVITLASPLLGTRSCDLFLPKTLDIINGNMNNVRNDMGYLSSTSSTTLDSLITNNVKCNNIYHVVPKYDHMIYPSDVAKYDFVDDDNIYEYNDLFGSHIGVPFNRKIGIKVSEWINL